MGVMSCSRRGCEHIMCNTYVEEVGYVCHSCQDEFKRLVGSGALLTSEIKNRLIKFMRSEKEFDHDTTETNVEDFFNDRRH